LLKEGGHMLTTNALSVFPTHKQFEQALGLSVGFDSVFNRLFECNQQNQSSGYPPYNLKKDGDQYIIELAVAGLSEKDIKVHVEDKVLTVSSDTEKSDEAYLHQGIARRSFKRSWTLADDMIVHDATMTSGMLIISLERIVPEEKKARQIPIVTK
tara:strand:+ start:3568 stop:4032 length:465 start_codon:yes stop_codon:yes gene_type:complete